MDVGDQVDRPDYGDDVLKNVEWALDRDDVDDVVVLDNHRSGMSLLTPMATPTGMGRVIRDEVVESNVIQDVEDEMNVLENLEDEDDVVKLFEDEFLIVDLAQDRAGCCASRGARCTGRR